MILIEQENDHIYNPNIMIPAIFTNGELIIGNNGNSIVFFGSNPEECRISKEHFQFFAISNPPNERPFFIAWSPYQRIPHGKICDSDIENQDNYFEMWELFYVYSRRKVEPDGQIKKKELQYTCLRHCRPTTLFCKCNECGERFVITPQTIKFYDDRNLKIPIYRCPKCIQTKRMRYAAKNK